MTAIDLNADVGESPAPHGAGADSGLLGLVTSVHVACGFHAGDPEVMRRMAGRAASAGVSVGAHPSYPDPEGFGRRPMSVPVERVVDDVLYQIGALDALARVEGTRVSSVKPHGALYGRMAVDRDCAAALAEAVLAYGGGLRLVLPAGSPAVATVGALGVPTLEEAFCDRAYLADGGLAPRGSAGALITEPAMAARRAVLLATRGVATAIDGTEVALRAQTLCVHGDTPGAVAIAIAVRTALEDAGLVVAAPG